MMSFEQQLYDLMKKAVKDAYHELQQGEEEVAPADKAQPAAEQADAGKRRRRTRAEIEADAKAQLAARGPAPAAPPAKFEYATLQNAVIAFLENYSGTPEEAKVAAQKILGQFGVAKAQALQPEQWEECHALFTAGEAEDESLA